MGRVKKSNSGRMERWNRRNIYLVVLCVFVTLWQKKKNATKTLRHKIAQKGNRIEE